MIRVLNCITLEHDLRLLALSACICVLGCFTTAMLLARIEQIEKGLGFRWLCAASVIFGCSVWSLHFVAMLAYKPQLSIAFNLWLTLLSIVIATGGAFASFWAWRRLPPPTNILVGGLGVGLSVIGMHYTGVAAMQFSGEESFDPGLVAVSVAFSLAFGLVAMARGRDLATLRSRLELAGWLALAICGLHFTGMTALTLVPGFQGSSEGQVIDDTTLAVLVGFVSLAIIVAALIATVLEQHLFQRALGDLVRMRLLSDLTQEALLIHRDRTVLELNSAGERLFGAHRDVVGRSLLELFAADNIPALLRREQCPPADRRPEEFEIVTADGVHVPVEFSCRVIDFMGAPATAVALRDLSDRKRDGERIRYLAHHDALTGLPNRYSLGTRLQLALDLANEQNWSVAVIYLDLDRFKPVNDLLGHAAGDLLLIESAKRITPLLRPADTLARIGGDEFVVIVANAASPETTLALASAITQALRTPFDIEGQRVEIGVSAGVAMYPSDGREAEVLLRAADTAMYQAKEDRGGGVRFFKSSMNEALQVRRQLEQELAQAIERNELELFYQPMVNGRTGETETFEALIRWRHPVRGLVSPAQFIPLAEQTDLIGRIGRWVIETACAAAAQWPQPWRVSVNVSPSQFRRSDVAAIVADSLRRSGLEANRVVVEITEGVFINDAANAVSVLSQLRALGVRLALDDFGTGFSSLSYLQMFKFDKIKIDQSFVRRLEENLDSLTIIRAIVNLGHNLGLSVTAEGVETEQQFIALQGLGCDQMQGYLFARPAPFPEILQAIEERAAVA